MQLLPILGYLEENRHSVTKEKQFICLFIAGTGILTTVMIEIRFLYSIYNKIQRWFYYELQDN